MFKPDTDDQELGFTNLRMERRLLAAIAGDQSGKAFKRVKDHLCGGEIFTNVDSLACYQSVANAFEKGSPLPTVKGKKSKDPRSTAKKLAVLHQKRTARELGDEIYRNINAPGEFKVNEVISTVEKRVARLKIGLPVPKMSQTSRQDIFDGILANVIKAHKARKLDPEATIGLPTPFRTLNMLTGGLQPGLHILAAEPACGKTTLALWIASHAAMRDTPVVFLTYEEPDDRLLLRAVCANANPKIDVKKMSEGYDDPKRLKAAFDSIGPRLKNLHVVMGSSSLEPEDLRSMAQDAMKAAQTTKCLVVIDYVQRWALSRNAGGEMRYQVARLISEVRDRVAIDLGIPVLAICSQNRLGYGTAGLASLKEAGELEFTADSIWIAIEDREDGDMAPIGGDRSVNLEVIKNRFGDRGTVPITFSPHAGSFVERKF